MLPEVKKLLDLFAAASAQTVDLEAKHTLADMEQINIAHKERMRDFRHALIEAIVTIRDEAERGEGTIEIGEILNYEPKE